jgi:hypothetical protein
MLSIEMWRLLHYFFSFAFVGTLVVCDWNSRAARTTQDWSQRALLWDIVRRATAMGLGTLFVLGMLGNLLSNILGYRMATDSWLRWVNGLWVAALFTQGAIVMAGARRLAGVARAAAGGGEAAGYDSALKRWRLGNLAQSILYIALLALMAFHWKA